MLYVRPVFVKSSCAKLATRCLQLIIWSSPTLLLSIRTCETYRSRCVKAADHPRQNRFDCFVFYVLFFPVRLHLPASASTFSTKWTRASRKRETRIMAFTLQVLLALQTSHRHGCDRPPFGLSELAAFPQQVIMDARQVKAKLTAALTAKARAGATSGIKAHYALINELLSLKHSSLPAADIKR